MKVLVPDTIELGLTGPDEIVVYDVTRPVPPHARDADVLVIWANPQDELTRLAKDLPRLRLVQTLAAGPDAVLAAGFDPSIPIANGRSLHDGPVAEHAVALILSLVRRLGALHEAQAARQWDTTVSRAQADPLTASRYTLDGMRVTIWGMGSIGARLAGLLAPFGAQVTGVARHAGTRSGARVVSGSDLDQVLATTDVLVSLLPATDDTFEAFDAARIKALPRHAVFVNVGRGATVNEEALVTALRDGDLAGAALDVTAVEPLPQDSPLWDAPNLILTPHIAGGRPQGATALVRENLDALRTGRPLRNVV